MTDKELVMRAKNDTDAFDRLYEKYFPQIFNYVMMRVRNRDIAEEVVSTVFFKALNKLYMFKFMSLPFSSWLYRIAINEISNYFRREKRDKKIMEKAIIETDVAYKEPKEEFSFEFIHNYISKLPADDQNLILLRFFEKKPFAEISQILKTKESTLRVKLHRALKKLETLIPEEVLKDVYEKVS